MHNALNALRVYDVSYSEGACFSDTGALAHITISPLHFQQAQAYSSSNTVMVGNG